MNSKFPYFHVDAFTSKSGTGNPAGVVLLKDWLPDATMQMIAYENNHSETAFVLVRATNEYQIRYFTPLVEIPLCGHATLSAARVLLEILKIETDEIIFNAKGGRLVARRVREKIAMTFPLIACEKTKIPRPALRT